MCSRMRNFFNKNTFSVFGRVVHKSFSNKYLFYTNIFISFTLSGAGDFVAQQYEITTKQDEIPSKNKYDLERTKNMSLSGCSAGVFTHFWYVFLDRAIPGCSFSIVMKKLILDQLFCSPLMIINMFVVVGLLEKKSCKEICQELEMKSFNLYFAEWIVWPPAQFVNFYFIPAKFRILYDNIISFGYDVYYSRIKYKRIAI